MKIVPTETVPASGTDTVSVGATTDDGQPGAGRGLAPVEVSLTVDGQLYSALLDPSTRALRAIRDVFGHVRPRRGCQEGICGKCESQVNGTPRRLCITEIGDLQDAIIATPPPRPGIFG